MRVGVGRRLEVAEDLASTELADQSGHPQVAGFDGAAELDASEPVDLVDVVARRS